MNRWFTLIAVIVVADAAAAAEVRLRSSAVCSGPVLRLNDVAEIIADDFRVTQALAEIPLCPAPEAGRQRSFSQHDIRQLVGLSGVDAKAAHVTGSESVTVTAGAASAMPLGRRPLVASGVRQAVFESDVDSNRKHPTAPSVARPVATPTIDGKELPQLVERGAIVSVHARAAGVRISTSGKAVEGGSAGELIRVDLADSKERVVVRVIGPQEVEVAAGGPIATAAANP